jgi:hypothetical protein
VAGVGQRPEPVVVAHGDEEPVGAVGGRRAEVFSGHGEDADTFLTGRLGDELFDPRPERRTRRGQVDDAFGLADQRSGD